MSEPILKIDEVLSPHLFTACGLIRQLFAAHDCEANDLPFSEDHLEPTPWRDVNFYRASEWRQMPLSDVVGQAKGKIGHLAEHFSISPEIVYLSLDDETVWMLLATAVKAGDEALANQILTYRKPKVIDDLPRSVLDALEGLKGYVLADISAGICKAHASVYEKATCTSSKRAYRKATRKFATLSEQDQYVLLEAIGPTYYKKIVINNEDIRHLMFQHLQLPDELLQLHEEKFALLSADPSLREQLTDIFLSIRSPANGDAETNRDAETEQKMMLDKIHDFISGLYAIEKPKIVFESGGEIRQGIRSSGQVMEHIITRDHYVPWHDEKNKVQFIKDAFHEMGHIIEQHIMDGKPGFSHLWKTRACFRAQGNFDREMIARFNIKEAAEECTSEKIDSIFKVDFGYYLNAFNERHANWFSDFVFQNFFDIHNVRKIVSPTRHSTPLRRPLFSPTPSENEQNPRP